MKPGQPAKSTAKPNIHSTKVMLCIWWDQKGVLYYELLKPGETINGESYRTQLIGLKREIAERRPEYATRHETIIFHHDKARPFCIPFVPVDAERPHWNTAHIRTGYQKLTLFILGR